MKGTASRHPPTKARTGKRSAQRRRRGGTGTGRSRKKVRRPRRDDAPKAVRRDQFAADAVIDCNWSITPGSTNTQACSSAIGTLNICANTVRRRCASRPVRYLLGLHAATGLRTAALRIAFDQRDEAIVGQLPMLGAQTPAGRRMALHARAQALVQQDGAGIERRAANEANMLFE